jgi:hypothetical protein
VISDVARARSFQTPRLSLVLLLLGLTGQSVARSRMASASAGRAAMVASLDSAITAAQPSSGEASLGDTATATDEHLRELVSRKRDAEVNARHASDKWWYAFLLSSGVLLAAIVTGAQALVTHVRQRP